MASLRNNDTDHSDDSDGEEALPAPKNKFRLFLRGRDIAKSITGRQPDTKCRISLDPGAPSKYETEIVYNSSNPVFTKSLPLDYESGSQLLIYVDIYVCKGKCKTNSSPELECIGRVTFDVKDIVSNPTKNPTKTKASRLRKGGTNYAYIEQVFSSQTECLSLQLRAQSLVFTKSKLRNSLAASTPLALGKPTTYFQLSRPASSSSSPWVVVYRSPSVTESDTPVWDEALIDLNSICSDGTALSASSVRISIYTKKKKKCKEIGSFETTIQYLLESCQAEEAARSTFELQPKAIKGRQSNEKRGKIMVVSANMHRSDEVRQQSQRMMSGVLSRGESSPLLEICSSTSKFSEYVNAGLDIDLCVAIDFTSSNGDPKKPGTLHYSREYSRDGMSNDYTNVIESIVGEVEKYSKSKEFPVWGFGAKFPSDASPKLPIEELQVQHFFQCGQTQSAIGTEGVLDAYRYVFGLEFYMSGPTVILPVIKAALSRANKVHKAPTKQLKYTVLLILTDGVVNDLESTKKLIVKYRHLPLSFVIVGIGRADFTAMNEWNNQVDLRGRFTFVEFRTLQFDPEALSRKALERLPEDVADYFISREK
mmetsp:Transcript_13222/g.21697  ORF Transcript_13222/g.21697 Transcript_13222/m.21697 type:complete len:594 (-) Transcript_13222:28-1809(-)